MRCHEIEGAGGEQKGLLYSDLGRKGKAEALGKLKKEGHGRLHMPPIISSPGLGE